MNRTIFEVLDALRASALDKREKGDKFERLIKAYLEIDPYWTQRFTDVQLWSSWSGRAGVPDIGIDLVAKNRDDDGWSAIQCKFYDPGERVQKSDIDSFLSLSYRPDFAFTQRYIFDTADGWSGNAEQALKGQVQRIDISWLDESGIDWSRCTPATPDALQYTGPKTLLPHQRKALTDVHAGLVEHDRGKMIMACGTGKTFTSLKIAEREVGKGGTALFLVPSIQLLSQSLREWMAETAVGIRPFAVCSDVRVGRRAGNDDDADISPIDLPEPATTDADKLVRQFTASDGSDRMTVVFSTYQSIDVIVAAQRNGFPEFDLVICDEAHRTSGVALRDASLSSFVKVHDSALLRARKRLYMTATPRVYDESVKKRADDAEAILFDMANESLFGPEFHRLGFGEAVEGDLLTDYKVLVLAVDEGYITDTFQGLLGSEIPLSEAAKLVGCWNGLDKHFTERDETIADWRPMRTAVAFAQNIRASKAAAEVFPQVGDYANRSLDADNGDRRPLELEARHVDGTMGIHERNAKLRWLKTNDEDDTCRILSNARCLTEGVDVPSLDAVLFLSGRSSQVDVVQAVGRVMRKAPAKELGYIILPVAIPAGVAPEEALKDNDRYKVVWQVLQALRSHDDRFNAEINKIDLNRRRSSRISVISVSTAVDGEHDGDGDGHVQTAMVFPEEQIRDAMYARIVHKVGERHYWPKWASEVALIAEAHIARITALLTDSASPQTTVFREFLDGLRGNLNDNITADEAIEMLAQHLITRPIFEALFEGYDFITHNPVAQAMERMLAVLDEHNLDTENQTLEKFYASVHRRVEGVDNAEGKQRILIDLYDNFFKAAFKRSQEKLGIVYTPVEVADFILRSADAVLREEFGEGLTDENVHVLDGFTGTGTFVVRLLQSGLIEPKDLKRKYQRELHANEILLLAYYLASVNIENTYRELTGDTEGFPGLILTDTFQSWEPDDRPDLNVFPENNQRLEKLKTLPITAIVGNPPYSVGQGSANDDNRNEAYPELDREIESTFAATSTATSKRTLYDSYIRAIKWASLRIRDRGVIAYVTNGGFIDSNSADGLRKALVDEFSALHIYNLLGNMRDDWKRQGGKIFGSGSQTTVAILLLVKNPERQGPAQLHYTEIGDYLTREQKLAKIATETSVLSLPAAIITPTEHGDWINQRGEDFETFLDIKTVFDGISTGLVSSRDSWAWGFSRPSIDAHARRSIAAYERERARLASRLAEMDDRQVAAAVGKDPKQISWSRGLRTRLRRGREIAYNPRATRMGNYRPFTRAWVHFDDALIEVRSQLQKFFPSETTSNAGIYLTAPSSHHDFCVLMADAIPDFHLLDTGQLFPRYRFEQADLEGTLRYGDDDGDVVVDGYRRIDNVTGASAAEFMRAYPGQEITKDAIFFYVYGLLHSPEYRETYAADLKKLLPRIPFATDFHAFVDAGRALSRLHLGYETAERYPLIGLDVEPPAGSDPYEFFAVNDKKMRFGNRNRDKTVVEFNDHITLAGLPAEIYRYRLGPRSALEWLIDRYYVKTDKASGIINDPNEWSKEVGNPRYILDLFARITTVALETMTIVDALPPLGVLEPLDQQS